MYLLLLKVFQWLTGKVVIYFLILGALILLFAVHQAPRLILGYQVEKLQAHIEEIETGREWLATVEAEVNRVRNDILAKQRAIEDLYQRKQRLEGWLRTLANIFNRAQLEAERAEVEQQLVEQQRELMAMRADERERLEVLQASAGEQQEKEAVVAELQRQVNQWQEINDFLHELMRTHVWQLARKAVLILLMLILLPIIWRVFAYYVLAPLAHAARPIAMEREGSLLPAHVADFKASTPALRVVLSPAEQLVLRENFLQSSTEHSDKFTVWMFRWRYLFTSFASGLFLLTGIRPRPAVSESVAAPECQVTISCQTDAATEISEVCIPDGQAAVFRPSFLVGMIFQPDDPPRIVSRWVFNRLHAWVNLRFRYLIIHGPVRLLFAAQRGVQMESVTPGAQRRINSRLTIAYGPQLAYSPRRAETFLAYFRGANPLFDDHFSGAGVIFNQQVAGMRGNGPATFWESFFAAIRKVFGL